MNYKSASTYQPLWHCQRTRYMLTVNHRTQILFDKEFLHPTQWMWSYWLHCAAKVMHPCDVRFSEFFRRDRPVGMFRPHTLVGRSASHKCTFSVSVVTGYSAAGATHVIYQRSTHRYSSNFGHFCSSISQLIFSRKQEKKTKLARPSKASNSFICKS